MRQASLATPPGLERLSRPSARYRVSGSCRNVAKRFLLAALRTRCDSRSAAYITMQLPSVAAGDSPLDSACNGDPGSPGWPAWRVSHFP